MNSGIINLNIMFRQKNVMMGKTRLMVFAWLHDIDSTIMRCLNFIE